MSQIHKRDIIQNRLIKVAHDLNEKNKYRHTDYDGQNYYGIRDAFRGDGNKELLLKQYINKVIPYFSELINKKKNDNQKKKMIIKKFS